MSGFVVVDASLAFKWLVREEYTDKALAILREWLYDEVTPIAPYLLPFEVSNALHKRVNRGELTVEAAVDLIGNLLDSQIDLHQPLDLHAKALEMASRFGQPATYDAHYLALAESLDCELWTADEKFFRTASPVVEKVRWIGAFVTRDRRSGS